MLENPTVISRGRVAQIGEHLLGKQTIPAQHPSCAEPKCSQLRESSAERIRLPLPMLAVMDFCVLLPQRNRTAAGMTSKLNELYS
jgi:hypothetical protein